MSSTFSNGAFLFPSLNSKKPNKRKSKEINKYKTFAFSPSHFSEIIKRIRFFYYILKMDVLRRRSFSNHVLFLACSLPPFFLLPACFVFLFFFVPEWLIDFVINWHAHRIRSAAAAAHWPDFPTSIYRRSLLKKKNSFRKNRPGTALAGNFNSFDWIFK